VALGRGREAVVSVEDAHRKRLGSTARTLHRTLAEAFPIKPSDKPEVGPVRSMTTLGSSRARVRNVCRMSNISRGNLAVDSAYGRLAGFRPRVLFKSSDFNDLPIKQSPHGGTVRMARNSSSR
jgi:hypothetical protein